MSSAPSPSNPGSPPPATPSGTPKTSSPGSKASDQIVVYRHSTLFYWWPVWALGFVFALFTLIHNQHLAVVPAGTEAVQKRKVEVDDNLVERDVLIVPAKKALHTFTDEDGNVEPVQPTIYVTHFRAIGAIYVVVLLFVITLTNVPVRGLWSVLVILVVIMLAIILGVWGKFPYIFQKLNQLSIYINLGGYTLISSVLLVLWAINFFLFDRQTYMIFSAGQLRVRLEIGGEETVYDTTGLVIQRERGDLFRHWVLGFGSGDLIIKPVGVPHPLFFPNVLRIEKLVTNIEQMMKEKVVVRSPDANTPSA